MQYTLGFLLFAALSFTPSFSFAEEDPYITPKVVAVQNRPYNLNQGIGFHVGYLPDDPFTRGVEAGASYTYYFTEFTGWEVINANYVYGIDRGLKNELRRLNTTADQDRQLDFIEYYVTTGVVYTPLYNKSLLFNKSIVYGETSFIVVGGAGKFKQAGYNPMIGGGLSIKFFLSPKTSLKAEVRDYAYFDAVRGALSIFNLKLAVEFQIGDTPRETE